MAVFAGLWLTVLLAGAATVPAVISVAQQGFADARGSAWITVSGSVLSIDTRRGTLVLSHGPLETAPRGVVECVFSNRRSLLSFHPGDWIMALARTDHHPWVLRYPRIIQARGTMNGKVA